VIKTPDYALTEWFSKKGERTASMLFDHRTDRDETKNLANDESFSAVLKGLRERLERSIKNR
ncbi:MAG: hypothetical protein ACR2PJ_05665, partial [Pseudomonadales bacterium]